jgi:hypothetical protein
VDILFFLLLLLLFGLQKHFTKLWFLFTYLFLILQSVAQTEQNKMNIQVKSVAGTGHDLIRGTILHLPGAKKRKKKDKFG